MPVPNLFTSLYKHRNDTAIALIVCMLVGFLCSRAILSIAIILFGANALVGVHPKKWLSQKWWLLGVLWIIGYAISWLWTDNTNFWQDRLQTKLPILLLPLAFGLLPPFSKKQLTFFTVSICILMLCGACYSTAIFLKNPSEYIEGYSYSHVIPTPVYNDHINFSMGLVLTICWCLYYLPSLQQTIVKYFTIISVIIFTIFIHLLAAQTGVLGIYIVLLAWVLKKIRKKQKSAAILTFLVVSIAALLLWKNTDTLQKRVGHTIYAYKQFTEGNISGDYGDIGRLVSYDLAIKIIKKHPLLGVGAGDILDEMGKLYKQYYPNFPKEQYLVPHNQFLTVAIAAGLVTAMVFTCWFFMPLRSVTKDRIGYFFVVAWLLLLLLLFINPTLEIQFGIFTFTFFFCWFKKALHDQNTAIENHIAIKE